jgi:hypothetical protein
MELGPESGIEARDGGDRAPAIRIRRHLAGDLPQRLTTLHYHRCDSPAGVG